MKLCVHRVRSDPMARFHTWGPAGDEPYTFLGAAVRQYRRHSLPHRHFYRARPVYKFLHASRGTITRCFDDFGNVTLGVWCATSTMFMDRLPNMYPRRRLCAALECGLLLDTTLWQHFNRNTKNVVARTGHS